MKKTIAIFLFPFLFSCSMQEDAICESGTGYLYKDGVEFVCPFSIQKEVGYKKWIDINLELNDVYVLPYDTEDNFSLYTGWFNGRPTYGISMKVPKPHFTEEQYTVSIATIDKNLKKCGEPREFIFHRIEENNDMVIYHSVIKDDYEKSEDGKELFFGERDMPSYDDWYHVLKVCSTEENKGFSLEGVVLFQNSIP